MGLEFYGLVRVSNHQSKAYFLDRDFFTGKNRAKNIAISKEIKTKSSKVKKLSVTA